MIARGASGMAGDSGWRMSCVPCLCGGWHLLQDRPSFERALAARLIADRKLDKATAERALRLRAEREERLEQILAKLGLAHEKDITEAISRELGLPLAAPGDYPDTPVLEIASPKLLREAQVLPLIDAPDRLVLAVTDPLNEHPVRSLALLAGKPVEIRVAAPSDIDLAYERLYGGEKSSIGQIVDEIEEAGDGGPNEDIKRLRDLASEAPVIRLVNLLIARAVEDRASDIHIEPVQNRLSVRYRVDGVLKEGATPPLRLRAAIVSRIKIMAKLNIAERRLLRHRVGSPIRRVNRKCRWRQRMPPGGTKESRTIFRSEGEANRSGRIRVP